MAGNASKTTVFTEVPIASAPELIQKQFEAFANFAQENKVPDWPKFGVHDVQMVSGFQQRYFARYVNPEADEPFDVDISLQTVSRNEDADVDELRAYYAIPGPVVWLWDQWQQRTIKLAPPPVAPVGPKLANGNYAMMTLVPVGTKLTIGGVTYEAVQINGMFALQWKVVG